MKRTKKDINLIKAKVKCVRSQNEQNLIEARDLLENEIALCGGLADAGRFLGVTKTGLFNAMNRDKTGVDTVLKWVEKFLPVEEK